MTCLMLFISYHHSRELSGQHRSLLTGLFLFALVGCQVGSPHVPVKLSERELGQLLQQRASLLVTLPKHDADQLLGSMSIKSAGGLSLSSATPVSPDGFFLTTAHSVEPMRAGDVSVVFYLSSSQPARGEVKVIWKDTAQDLALIKAPFLTPHFYRWSPRGKSLTAGIAVIHGGISTGPEGRMGVLLHDLSGAGRQRPARHSLRLKPGDSGGPLLLTSGELVGINQSVGFTGIMDTTFFTDSRCVRPDPSSITALISKSQLP